MKAIKILWKNLWEKHFRQKKFYEKTNLDKKIFFFGKISEVPKFGYFLKVTWKTMFFYLEHIWSISYLHSMQCLAWHNNCWYVTRYHSCNLCYNYVHTVSCTIGYCLYRTLLLHPCWTACPVQIGAHHHIDIYTDIN